MFNLEAALILNRFQVLARLSELETTKQTEEPAEDDRARRDEVEENRRRYVEEGIRRIREWERRVSGGK